MPQHSTYANQGLLEVIVKSHGEKSLDLEKYNAMVIYSYNFSPDRRKELKEVVVEGILNNKYEDLTDYWLTGGLQKLEDGSKIRRNEVAKWTSKEHQQRGLPVRRLKELNLFHNKQYCYKDNSCYSSTNISIEIAKQIEKELNQKIYVHNPSVFMLNNNKAK